MRSMPFPKNLDSTVPAFHVGLDSAGAEKFVAVFGWRPAMKASAEVILAQCPPGTRIYIEGAVYTAATAENPKMKNLAFYRETERRGVEVYVIGTHTTKTITKGKKTDWKDAAAIRWIGIHPTHGEGSKQEGYPRHRWNPTIPPKHKRRGQLRKLMAIRHNTELFAQITTTLRENLCTRDLWFFRVTGKKWSVAAVCAIYHAAVTTHSRDDFEALLGYTGLGAKCACRGVIMQLWRTKKKRKGFIRAIRHARSVLRADFLPTTSVSTIPATSVLEAV